MQAKLILFFRAHLLSFMCFLISSFATQMCLHNGYADRMYAFPTATPTDTKQAAVTSGTDVPNGHTTAFEDKWGWRGSVKEDFRNGMCCLQETKATQSQVQCAAAANPISKVKLRTQKNILTLTKRNKRGSWQDQIYSMLLLSLKQNLKCG